MVERVEPAAEADVDRPVRPDDRMLLHRRRGGEAPGLRPVGIERVEVAVLRADVDAAVGADGGRRLRLGVPPSRGEPPLDGAAGVDRRDEVLRVTVVAQDGAEIDGPVAPDHGRRDHLAAEIEPPLEHGVRRAEEDRMAGVLRVAVVRGELGARRAREERGGEE
jgi:hypothetical protein